MARLRARQPTKEERVEHQDWIKMLEAEPFGKNIAKAVLFSQPIHYPIYKNKPRQPKPEPITMESVTQKIFAALKSMSRTADMKNVDVLTEEEMDFYVKNMWNPNKESTV